MMQKKSIFLLALFFLLIIGTFLLFKKNHRERLEIVEPKRDKIRETISESGILEKGELVNVYCEIGGKVEKVFVSEGEEVEKGQLLAKLEDKDAKTLLERTEISLEAAKKNFEKLKIQYQQLERGDQKEEILKKGISILKDPLEQMMYTLKNLEDLLFQEDLEPQKQNIEYYSESNQQFSNYPSIISQKLKTTKEIYQNALNEYQKLKEKNGTEKERIINLSYQLFSNVAEIAKLAKAPIHYLKEITLNFNLTHDKGALIEQHFSFLSQIDTQFSELSQNLLTIINKLNDYYNQLETISLELEAQELQIKEKEKLLSEAERNLKKHYLYSPAKGTISKIYLKEGETVNLMGQNLAFQILPDSPFEIKVDIYENEIPKITLNTPVEISFPQFPNEIFFGKVSFISQVPKIKEGVVYYEVKIKPEKLPEKVFSGMSCDVKIIVKEKEDVLVLPREALKKKEGKYFVEVLKEGKKIEKEIGVGIFGEDFVEILSGLKEGEKVILP